MVNLNERPRRDPIAIIKSLEFEGEPRYLIVEGEEDRLFLEYLSSEDFDSRLIILEIDSIEISEPVEDGNKGRLFYMAENLPNEVSDRIKFFADRDYIKYTERATPENVILTDYKDIEAYLFEEDFLDKFLKVGIKTNKISGKDLIVEVCKAKFWGLVRIASIGHQIHLKVNATNEKLYKYIKVDKQFKISLDREKYLSALLSNSKHPLTLNQLKKLIDQVEVATSNEDFRFIIHGKDTISLLSTICHKLGYKNDDVTNVIWMSFDKSRIVRYPNLVQTIEFTKRSNFLN